MESRKPSSTLAIAAALLPLLAIATTPIAFLVMASSIHGRAIEIVKEMGGPGALLVIGGAIAGAIATAALLFFAARGARVPAVLVLLSASLPWLGGLVGTALGMRMVDEAMGQLTEQAMRAALMAQGVSEASLARVSGGLVSGALLGAASLGLALAALAQRAPERRTIGALVGLLAMPSAVAIGLGAMAGYRGLAGMLAILPALVALVAAALAGLAAGRDEPNARSSALAAASGVPAVLAVVLVLSAVSTLEMLGGLRAFAMVSASDRGAIAFRAAEEISRGQSFDTLAIALAALPMLGIALWAAMRARPDGSRAAFALVLVVVAGLIASPALGPLDFVLSDPAPWSDDATFVASETTGGQIVGTPIVVDPTRVLVRPGDAIDLATLAFEPGRRALAAKLRPGLPSVPPAKLRGNERRSRAELVRDAAEWPTPTYQPRLVSDRYVSEPQIAIAFDARVRGDQITNVLAAAAEAGARSVRLVGVSPGAGNTPDRRTLARSASPLLASLVEAAYAHTVLLEPALAPGAADADRDLLHGTIERASVTVRPRAQSTHRGLVVSARSRPDERERERDDETVVYLAWRADTTAGDLVRITDHLRQTGRYPLLVTGAFPGHPEMPAPEGSFGDSSIGAGLGLRGQGGGGLLGGPPPGGIQTHAPASGAPSSVVGSLPADAVRRVIRRNMPAVRACYDRLLAERPTAAGRVIVHFVISRTGAVESASVTQSTLGHASTERCIASATRRWTFPAPEGGGVVTVNYPFVLEAAR